MNKKSTRKSRGEVPPEHDFSNAVRGKYARQFAEGTNIIILAPDVAKVFADSNSVNEALRVLMRLRVLKTKKPRRAS